MANCKPNEKSQERNQRVYSKYLEYKTNGYKPNVIKHILAKEFGISENYVKLIWATKGKPSDYVTRSKNREIRP